MFLVYLSGSLVKMVLVGCGDLVLGLMVNVSVVEVLRLVSVVVVEGVIVVVFIVFVDFGFLVFFSSYI